MKDGDFIRLDFDVYVKETDQLIDTTHEEVAKEHEVHSEGAQYKPIPIIIGVGHVVKGLDKDLLDAKVGKEREIEVPPEDAFGPRDPKLVEVMPMNKILSLPEFRKGDRYPQEGMELRINNRIGVISRIFAGRVRLDFNKRYAGRTVVYKYTVKELIKDRDEKIRAVFESSYGGSDEFSFKFISDDEVEILLPDMVKLDSNWMMAKFKLVSDLRAHMGIKSLRLVEEYVKKEEEEEEHVHTEDCDHDGEGDQDAPEDEKKEEKKPKAAKKKAAPKKEKKE
ncbi:MAG: peptidylprolyl isomerase [Thermoplasmata archaeon]|nr:peptidylprolyl isomerase [Thermoplasmata archaeon]